MIENRDNNVSLTVKTNVFLFFLSFSREVRSWREPGEHESRTVDVSLVKTAFNERLRRISLLSATVTNFAVTYIEDIPKNREGRDKSNERFNKTKQCRAPMSGCIGGTINYPKQAFYNSSY